MVCNCNSAISCSAAEVVPEFWHQQHEQNKHRRVQKQYKKSSTRRAVQESSTREQYKREIQDSSTALTMVGLTQFHRQRGGRARQSGPSHVSVVFGLGSVTGGGGGS